MKKWIQFIIGIVISAAGLQYSFDRINVGELWLHLEAVKLPWLAVAIFFLMLSMLIRVKRWQLIISPLINLHYYPLWSATLVGYFGNAVLPFRIGEILRAYSISSGGELGTSEALGSIVLERILDMLGLVCVMMLFGLYYPVGAHGNQVMLGVVAITGCSIGVLLELGRSESLFVKIFGWFGVSSSSFVRSFGNILCRLASGVSSIIWNKNLGIIGLHTILLWVLCYYIVFCVSLATGVNISWVEVGVVLLSTSLAALIPSAPGAIGTYHAAAVYVMTNYCFVGRVESQAFAVVLHTVNVLPFVIIGGAYFLKEQFFMKGTFPYKKKRKNV